jgi:hypothetical protein
MKHLDPEHEHETEDKDDVTKAEHDEAEAEAAPLPSLRTHQLSSGRAKELGGTRWSDPSWSARDT